MDDVDAPPQAPTSDPTKSRRRKHGKKKAGREPKNGEGGEGGGWEMKTRQALNIPQGEGTTHSHTHRWHTPMVQCLYVGVNKWGILIGEQMRCGSQC